MGILSRISNFGEKYFLKPATETFINPVAREFIRPVTSAVRGVQALVPGGKTGKESMQTPFGEVKPYSELSTGEALKGAAELALSVPGAVGKIAAPIAKVAGPVVRPVATAVGNAINKSAIENIGKVLAPTTKTTKAITQKISQEVLDRGLFGTFEGIQRTAKEGLELAGEALDDFGKIEGDTAVSKITDVLDKAKQSFFVTSGERSVLPNSAAETAVKYLDYLKGQLVNVADESGSISREALRAFRQAWDATIKKANGFAGNIDDTTKAGIEKVGADTIREILASEVPDLARLNREYSFFRGLTDVLSETTKRKVGQRGIVREVATAAGAAAGSGGGPGVSAAFALGARYLSDIASSALVRSATAQVQNKLARALLDGTHSVERIASFIKGASLTALKASDLNRALKEAELSDEEMQSYIDQNQGLQEIFGSQSMQGDNKKSSLDEIFGRGKIEGAFE